MIEKKIDLSKDLGVNLICIPYWWNNSSDTLISLIKSQRKDLLLNYEDKDVLLMPPQPEVKLKILEYKPNDGPLLPREWKTYM